MEKLAEANKETIKVVGWVFVSAGLMAVITWALGKPEYLPYYGLLNIFLFWLKELKEKRG